MVPLVSLSEELRQQREVIDEVARQVMGEQGMTIEYRVGTMIELPRAALMADNIAAACRLLFVWHKRSDANNLWSEPRRLESLSCPTTLSARFCRTIRFRCWIAKVWANWFGLGPSAVAA